MSDENVFTQKLNIKYKEPAIETNLKEFDKVIRSRRSVRVFESDPVDDSVIETALEHGFLAPNSSNLQPWEFHWIKNPELKKEVARICVNQNGARTAAHLIVCVARTDTWKSHCKKMLEELKIEGQELPPAVVAYYSKLAPAAYGMIGPFGIFSPFKWLLITILGMFQMVPRKPIWPAQLVEWAAKTTALACENIMLSLRAQGYDSLPMEGFDEKRLKKLLKLSRHQHVVMVIAAGKRAEGGVYGPQFRFDSKQFVKKYD